MSTIFLIRHGESEGNVDRNVYRTKPDHAIELSELGKQQAIRAGKKLVKHVIPMDHHVSWWTSPYMRTRQTAAGVAQGFLEEAAILGGKPRNIRWCESINLVEQQYGLFDGIPDDDLPNEYPAEYAHYKKSEDFEGRFWARMPLGESRFDVTLRTQQFANMLRNSDTIHVVVAHGVTIRALVMNLCDHEWEWFEKEPNPENASIRMLSSFGYPSIAVADRGYVD